MKFNYAISKDFSNLFEKPIDYNVIIKVGTLNTKEFKAHSIILRSRLTDHFYKEISKAKYENGIMIFTKPDISAPVFEILLK